jgi:hypothetical protein
MKPWDKELTRKDLLESASNELASALMGCKWAKLFLHDTGVDIIPLNDIIQYLESYKNYINSEQSTVTSLNKEDVVK